MSGRYAPEIVLGLDYAFRSLGRVAETLGSDGLTPLEGYKDSHHLKGNGGRRSPPTGLRKKRAICGINYTGPDSGCKRASQLLGDSCCLSCTFDPCFMDDKFAFRRLKAQER